MEKMLIYLRSIWNILQIFGIFYDHLVHFVFLWYIFSCFGIMYPEKSGNPAISRSGMQLRPSYLHTETTSNDSKGEGSSMY
jgi:hypothetical protein